MVVERKNEIHAEGEKRRHDSKAERGNDDAEFDVSVGTGCS